MNTFRELVEFNLSLQRQLFETQMILYMVRPDLFSDTQRDMLMKQARLLPQWLADASLPLPTTFRTGPSLPLPLSTPEPNTPTPKRGRGRPKKVAT